MRMDYYPGCSLLGSAKEFNESVRAVCEAIDLTLEEVPDWNCCGASSTHALNHDPALALAVRILAQAEATGFEEVLAPCVACFNPLVSTRAVLEADPVKRREIAELIELPYSGGCGC